VYKLLEGKKILRIWIKKCEDSMPGYALPTGAVPLPLSTG